MSSLEEKKFLRLIKFSGDISSQVFRAFTESNILTNHSNSFSVYLTTYKHDIYHLYQEKNPCCSCIGALGQSSRRYLYQEQFDKLFSMSGVTIPSHVKRNKHNSNIVTQHCICNVTVNSSCCLDDLDITLLHTLIKIIKRSLQPNDLTSLKTIKDVRNYLAHVVSTTGIQICELDKWWKQLESAVLALASKVPPKFYKDSIQVAISCLRVAEFPEEEVAELKSKYDQMKKEVNTLKDGRIKDAEILKELSENCSANKNAVLSIITDLQETVLKGNENIRKHQDRNFQDLKQNQDQKYSELQGQLTTILQAIIENKEKPSRCPETLENRTVDVGCQVDGDDLDVDMAVEELSKRTGTDEQLDKFDIKKAKKGSLLLDLSASPDVLRSPKTLKAAIRDLTERIIKAGNVDTSVPGNLHIRLIFKSALTEDELQVIRTVFSNSSGNKENEQTVAEDYKTNIESEIGDTQHTEQPLSTDDELQVIRTVFSNKNENSENELTLLEDCKTNIESEIGDTQHAEEPLSTDDNYVVCKICNAPVTCGNCEKKDKKQEVSKITAKKSEEDHHVEKIDFDNQRQYIDWMNFHMEKLQTEQKLLEEDLKNCQIFLERLKNEIEERKMKGDKVKEKGGKLENIQTRYLNITSQLESKSNQVKYHGLALNEVLSQQTAKEQDLKESFKLPVGSEKQSIDKAVESITEQLEKEKIFSLLEMNRGHTLLQTPGIEEDVTRVSTNYPVVRTRLSNVHPTHDTEKHTSGIDISDLYLSHDSDISSDDVSDISLDKDINTDKVPTLDQVDSIKEQLKEKIIHLGGPKTQLLTSDIDEEVTGKHIMSDEAHLAPTDELRIVLLGKPGSGKSKTGDVILGKNVFYFRLSGVCVTQTCVQYDAKRFGKRVSVVDTPAVLIDTPDVFNTRMQEEIKRCIWLTSPGPHAIILCVPIGYFTTQDVDIVNHFVSHFDEALMKYVIIVFTRLDVWKRDEEDKGRESNGNIDGFIDSLTECPRNFLQRCKNRFIAFDNTLKEKEAEQQVQRLISIIENMVQENGGTHYSNDDYAKAENILQEKIAEEKPSQHVHVGPTLANNCTVG